MRPKIRQEMRKENEKRCPPKLSRDVTITQARMKGRGGGIEMNKVLKDTEA